MEEISSLQSSRWPLAAENINAVIPLIEEMELRKVGNENKTKQILGESFQNKVRGVDILFVARIHVAFGGNQQLAKFKMAKYGRDN